MKKAVVIGSGFAGMSAACFLAQAGWKVTVLEKNETAGGRARQFKKDGFVFDMGPSWYWMPDVFEKFFNCFGKKVSDYYTLIRLNPSYRIYWEDGITNVPACYDELKEVFEKTEPGSGNRLDQFMKEAAYKYETGMNKLVYKPGKSVAEFIDVDVIKGVFKLDIFSDIKKHIGNYFKNPKLKQLLEFPVLFLGALPEKTPALYSLMNYADSRGGTWYPEGGMYKIVEAMHNLATELGVCFRFNSSATAITVENNVAKNVTVTAGSVKESHEADVVISGADYHFTETSLLEPQYRSYTAKYWESRAMAPSCILFFIGLNKKLKNVLHHNLFFDADFSRHGAEIYTAPAWPANPLFYACIPSVTDDTVAPENSENIFFLIPVAAGLTGDTEEIRNKYLEIITTRFEEKTGEKIKENIIFKKSYSVQNFIEDYNSFKGNAYGLANTLRQTALLKPKCQSKKIKNLFYTGQLTVPGPGVPPSLISGQVVASEILKQFT